ncbi:BrnT family toxin [Gloeobacter violaceus]|uniref:BrnT family toxin n=1 Tax=Gloeobacter violaceus TaxID=33072 RepID=UPI0013E8B5E0|nr:BrnT family toxin [Gloeobacter violaceus]
MAWTWDEAKNRTNKRDHGLSFEAAQYVFADPLALSRPDPYPHEERWQTVGLIGQMTVFVVHTWLEVEPVSGEESGRIISARRATAYERAAYEEGAF